MAKRIANGNVQDRPTSPSPRIVCYRCAAEFEPQKAIEDARGRRCPRCGAKLYEERFDARATRLLSRAERFRRYAERCSEAVRNRNFPGLLRVPLRLGAIVRRKSAFLRLRAKLLEDEAAVLAQSRYFAGLWFKSGHVPLRSLSKGGKLHYEMEARYVPRKGFELRAVACKDVASGVVGEFEVFERLRRLTVDPRSFLHRACLVHNVHIPLRDAKRRSVSFREIDIVAITQACVFVIEVKHKRANVSCRFERMDSGQGSPGVIGKAAREAVEQITLNAHAFGAWYSSYPPERVCRVVVFVDPLKFATNASHFQDGCYVGACPDGWAAAIAAMGEVHRSLGSYLTQREVGELGKDMHTKLGSAHAARETAKLEAGSEGLFAVPACPGCGARLSVDGIRGVWQEGAACACGTRLRPGLLDGLARGVACERSLFRQAARSCRQKADRLEGEAVPLFARNRAARLRRRDEDARLIRAKEREALGACVRLDAELERLARFRYCSGTWYARTRIPLERDDADARYRIETVYRRDGSFALDLRSGGVRASRIVSEFQVFELLQSAVDDPTSPLHGGMLLPNLYLPRVGDGKVREQVDCVLLTERCAFVFEVVRHAGSVLADAKTETVLIGNLHAEGAGSRLLEHPLRALSRHAEQFASLPAPFSFGRIYEVMVFVEPDSFESTGGGFANCLAIGCIPQGAHELVSTLEGRVRMGKERASMRAVRAFGEALMAAYGSAAEPIVGEHSKRTTAPASMACVDGLSELRLTA